MFISHKAPARGLGQVLKNHSKFDDTSQTMQQTYKARLTTIARLSTAPARKPYNPAKERQRAERDQLTRLLKESPGKRDARNFLKQFDTPKAKKKEVPASSSPKPVVGGVVHDEWGLAKAGVNLGKLYEPTVFTREPLPEQKYGEEEESETSHVGLVKLRLPQVLDDTTLGGIAHTLSQMVRLGLSTVVVLDCDEDVTDHFSGNDRYFANTVSEQAARLVAALEEYNEAGALLVEQALSYSSRVEDVPSTVQVRGRVKVQNNFLLYPPIDEGVIPVIMPYAHDKNLKKVRVLADDVVLAVAREFMGVSEQASVYDPDDSLFGVPGKNDSLAQRPLLDRIIILDPLGGIPSANRSDGAHVFVNLEAEYRDIERELRQLSITNSERASTQRTFYLGSGNPFSKFVDEEIVPLPGPSPQSPEGFAPVRHLKNLEVVQRALKLLPAESSGLILTPIEAATKPIPDDAQTTPRKNPLLHNVLTDKPMISSSLPTSPTSRYLGSAQPNPPTFFKRGVPLTMIPDPRKKGPWRPPSESNPSIELADDPDINFPKLEELINDSFRRKLDAKDYLNRIRGRVAGIIVAGDYEGCAICTWETPSSLMGKSVPEMASETPDSPYWVPYLDKFAVLTSSQGSGGVSDIVWAALTRTCFPEGVVWRSRTSNPVNKWYQERSKGTWNLPGNQWTMFWTTQNVTEAWEMDKWGAQGKAMTRWDAYVDVCKGIQPSWADGIKRDD